MKFAFTFLISAIGLVSFAIAHDGQTHHNTSTSSNPNDPSNPNHVMGDYVVLTDDDDPRSVQQIIQELGAGDDPIHHIYENKYFKGFAATMKKHCVDKLPTFQGIRMYEKAVAVRALEIQKDATWGLSRISREDAVGADQDPLQLNYDYSFNKNPAGAGVSIYVVDTGVNVKHVDFQGRATFGFSFDGKTFFDDNGHGTHCAGTAASTTLGVAKSANIIAVKVLNGTGEGSNSGIIAGIDWVLRDHEKKSKKQGFRGSVISMSLGSETRSPALDNVLIRASTQGKIHISVAAGNEGQDACNTSPAFSSSNKDASIISVGAIDIGDERAPFSNVGSCVTTYAPGVRVLSTFIDKKDPENGSNNLIQVLDGTSMACPHVTGLIAYYLAENPDLALDPPGLKKLIVESSVKSSALGPVRFQQKNPFTGEEKTVEIEGDPQIIATNRGVPLTRRAIRGMKPWRMM